MIESFIKLLDKIHKRRIKIIRKYWWLILTMMFLMATFPFWAKYL